MRIYLHPIPRIAWRVAVLAALAAFISISHARWPSKVGFCFWMAFFLGSYRVARISDGWFERRMVLFFIPLRLKRWHLQRFTDIETKYDEGMNIGWAVVIGPALWLWSHFFDWIVPWLGGNYQLRMRHVKGGPVLVWQGNSESNFEANLEILRNNTGLPVKLRVTDVLAIGFEASDLLTQRAAGVHPRGVE